MRIHLQLARRHHFRYRELPEFHRAQAQLAQSRRIGRKNDHPRRPRLRMSIRNGRRTRPLASRAQKDRAHHGVTDHGFPPAPAEDSNRYRLLAYSARAS
jgi:hypothetical protein